MKCEDARTQAIEHARTGASLDAHFETCMDCARFLKTQLALQSALAVIATETPEPEGFPPSVPALSPRRTRWWIPATAGAIAAAAFTVFTTYRPRPVPQSRPFIQIPYTAPLAPYERASIVRMNVPLSALISAGFEVHAPDAGAMLPADVLVGQDGRAHAIRLVQISSSKGE